MNKLSEQPGIFARLRGAAVISGFSVFVFFSFLAPTPTLALELDHPSSVIDTDDKLPVLSSPSPVPANSDSCLALLKSVRYVPTSQMDRNNRHHAGTAAALGLVFGVRFALGPKETNKPGKRKSNARFDIWQPQNDNGRQALAVADYRRCKNEQALQAISDWRWKR